MLLAEAWQNLLQRKDYSEVKELEKQQIQEDRSDGPLSFLKQEMRLPREGHLPRTGGLLIKDEAGRRRVLHKQNLSQ